MRLIEDLLKMLILHLKLTIRWVGGDGAAAASLELAGKK